MLQFNTKSTKLHLITGTR